MIEISKDINRAAELLRNHEVVAIPTETVYGLAANALDEEAVRKIFEIKKRPLSNPLILHIHDLEKLDEYVTEVPPLAKQLIEAFWPGPLTLVLPKRNTVPDIITAGQNTVAIRMLNHPLSRELLAKLDFPLAAPSANPFQAISPTQASHVVNYFPHEIKMVLDGGDCAHGIESSIIGFNHEGKAVLYRLGSLSVEEIEKVSGKLIMNKKEEVITPGMLDKHYSPRKKLVLVDDIKKWLQENTEQQIAILSFNTKYEAVNICQQEILSAKGDLHEAMSNLYNAMMKLDEGSAELILAEMLPNTSWGISINDRLTRASN